MITASRSSVKDDDDQCLHTGMDQPGWGPLEVKVTEYLKNCLCSVSSVRDKSTDMSTTLRRINCVKTEEVPS